MFNPEKISEFRFTKRVFDPLSGRLSLGYALDDTHSFTEHYTFPPISRSLSDSESALVERLLLYLHLAAGVSYYKTSIPKKISIDSEVLSFEEAAFFEKLYLRGLGEFAYKNSLSLRDRIRFPSQDTQIPQFAGYEKEPSQEGLLVPLGGGKDSLLTFEIAKRLGRPMAVFILGQFPAIEDVARLLDAPCFIAQRSIDPLLLQLNREGAFNGHVPISAIFSLSALITGFLHDYQTVLASQERSANSGNLIYDGMEINHQYSKSLEFERDFSELLENHLSQSLRHFSLLRPFSEVHIAKLFSKLSIYHSVFTSCNASFKLASDRKRIWCGNCPKCRFLFLILAPFLTKPQLIGIFGKNLFSEREQLQGFIDLLGFGNMKPFECVGEFSEARWCLLQLAEMKDWNDELIVKELISRMPAEENSPVLTEEIFKISSEHRLPAEFERVVHEFASA